MQKPNDLNQSRIILKQDSTLIAVIEMSLFLVRGTKRFFAYEVAPGKNPSRPFSRSMWHGARRSEMGRVAPRIPNE